MSVLVSVTVAPVTFTLQILASRWLSGEVLENVGEGAPDGNHALDILKEQPLLRIGFDLTVVHLLVVQDGVLLLYAEFIAHVPHRDEGRVNGGVADLEAVAADTAVLVVVVGDAVGVVAVGACGTALALLFGRAEPPPLLHRCDHGQVPVHKENSPASAGRADRASWRSNPARRLLAVKGCPALPAVLTHDERINPVCVQPAPDLGIHIVPGGERLTVTAVAVRPRCTGYCEPPA